MSVATCGSWGPGRADNVGVPASSSSWASYSGSSALVLVESSPILADRIPDLDEFAPTHVGVCSSVGLGFLNLGPCCLTLGESEQSPRVPGRRGQAPPARRAIPEANAGAKIGVARWSESHCGAPIWVFGMCPFRTLASSSRRAGLPDAPEFRVRLVLTSRAFTCRRSLREGTLSGRGHPARKVVRTGLGFGAPLCQGRGAAACPMMGVVRAHK